MKNKRCLRALLALAGLTMVGVGAAVLTVPVAFYAASHIDVPQNVNMLNELRPSGGVLVALGCVVLSGIFVSSMLQTATLISAMVYLAYGLSRLLSLTIDGMPHQTLIYVICIEMGIGIACLIGYVRDLKSASPT